MWWKKLGKIIWDWRGVWIVTPSVATMLILLRLSSILQIFELLALDGYFRLRPLEPRDDRILIVGIEEDDIKKLRQWPINDEILAEVINKIKAQQPKVIGLDIYRDLPVEPGYSQLKEVFETTPNLIGIENVGLEIDPPPILSEKGQVGVNDLVVDPDGKQRRALLSRPKNDTVVPSFNFLITLHYLYPEGFVPEYDENDPTIFTWGNAAFEPFKHNDGSYIQADDGGYQVLLNYRGPSNSFKIVSLSDVLDGKISPTLMQDRIVLIGATATSLNDFFYTPYSDNSITTPERMTGVEIQANIISQYLSAVLNDRKLLKTWSDPVEYFWIFLWTGISATLSWSLRYAGGSAISVEKGGAFILLVVILIGSTYLAFLQGWWIPVVPPFIALVGAGLAITSYIAYTAGSIRKTFGRYLNEEVVANLLENPKGLTMGGEKRKITILTSDLRGFTAFSERLSPEEVIKVLNFYLGYMADIITKYGGTIDEFMGDGILVLFGAPTKKEDDIQRAIACAIEMQLAMKNVNERMSKWGAQDLEMGIGINTGEVVVGNIGSEKRTKYGIVGSQVNLTYRIESNTIGGQILISESTFQEAQSMLTIDDRKMVQMKGVKEPIPIYSVVGIGGEYNLFLRKEKQEFFSISGIPTRYKILSGKQISDDLFVGSLVELSEKGGKIKLDGENKPELPKELANIKLNLLLEETNQYSDDVYAKVLSVQPQYNYFEIRFTSKPTQVSAKLDILYQQAKK